MILQKSKLKYGMKLKHRKSLDLKMCLAPCRQHADSQRIFLETNLNFVYKDIVIQSTQHSLFYEYCLKKFKLAHLFITLKDEVYMPSGLVSVLLLEAKLK